MNALPVTVPRPVAPLIVITVFVGACHGAIVVNQLVFFVLSIVRAQVPAIKITPTALYLVVDILN